MEEVTGQLHVTKRTLYRLAQKGGLPAFRPVAPGDSGAMHSTNGLPRISANGGSNTNETTTRGRGTTAALDQPPPLLAGVTVPLRVTVVDWIVNAPIRSIFPCAFAVGLVAWKQCSPK